MADDSATKLTVTMKTITCQCGVFYLLPAWTEGYQCPCCGWRRTELVHKDLERAEKDIRRLSRANNTLHGVITKLKKARRPQ